MSRKDIQTLAGEYNYLIKWKDGLCSVTFWDFKESKLRVLDWLTVDQAHEILDYAHETFIQEYSQGRTVTIS